MCEDDATDKMRGRTVGAEECRVRGEAEPREPIDEFWEELRHQLGAHMPAVDLSRIR